MNRLRLRSQTTIGEQAAPSHPAQQQVAAPDESSNTAASLSIDQVRTTWNELVNAVRAIKPSLAHFLNGATLVGLEGHVLKLGFGEADRFAMDQVLNNRESVEEIAEAKYGRRLRLEAIAKKEISRPHRRRASPSRPYAPFGARHF